MLKFVKIFNFGRCEGFEPSPLVPQTNTLPIELTSPYTLCTLNFYSSYVLLDWFEQSYSMVSA